MPWSQAAILYSKCQFLSDSSSVHPSLIPPCRSQRSWTQMKVKYRQSFSLNLHPFTKMTVSVIKNVNILFSQQAILFFVQESKEGEVSVVYIVMKKWKLSKCVSSDLQPQYVWKFSRGGRGHTHVAPRSSRSSDAQFASAAWFKIFSDYFCREQCIR